MKKSIVVLLTLFAVQPLWAGFNVMDDDGDMVFDDPQLVDEPPASRNPTPPSEGKGFWENWRYSTVPQRGWYVRAGVGDPRMKLSSIENVSSNAAVKAVAVSKTEDHGRVTHAMASLGYRIPNWMFELEFLYSKNFYFTYDPMLNAAPAGLPTNLLQAEYSVMQWVAFANTMYKFPHIAYQPPKLDFYALLGFGAAYINGNVQTTGKTNAVAATSPTPIRAGQVREVNGRSAGTFAAQFGVGMHYSLFPRLFIDASIRASEHGAYKFGPVEADTVINTQNEGVRVRIGRIRNVGLYAGFGMPLG